MKETKTIYRITFVSRDVIYEIYAGSVSESSLFGFLEVEDFIFGETTSVVLDPSEERLRHEFKGVKRTYIPIQDVLRIDEVEKRGKARIRPVGDVGELSQSNISHLPPSFYLNKDKSK